MLTNIGNNNIEGIPADLKTIYVQHDDISDDHNINIVDEVFNSKEVQRSGASKERIRNALQEIGFTELMMSSPRSTLSGGWKMKLMIMKAMMSDVDVLLLDEVSSVSESF